MSRLFSPSGTAFSTGNTSGYTVVVDPTLYYQTMDGFGASLTDSSAWLIANKLTSAQQGWLMQTLFAPSSNGGISLSLLRQPMGASDFAVPVNGGSGNYSYDDTPGNQADPNLAYFSIAHDQQYIIPQLKQALSYNSSLRIHALPWSPPAWMKNNLTMNGGQISASAMTPLANYFVKFVQAYQAAGVPIYALSAQNEPENSNSSYPTASVNANDEATFIGSYLGPALSAAGLGTKIMGYEHNWDDTNYPETVLGTSSAYNYLAGTSFHCYDMAGDRNPFNPAALNTVKLAYPAKDVWFTECTGTGRTDFSNAQDSATQTDFGNDLVWAASNLMIGTTRNWARGVTEWNLALDQNHGPTNGGCTSCRGVVTIDTSKSPAGIYMSPEFYALGHLSAAVKPGAQRIYSNTFGSGSLEDVAFKNPDGSTVLFVLNGSGSAQTFTTYWQGSSFNFTLQGKSVATLSWPAGTPPTAGISSSAWYNVISQNSYSCVDGQVASFGSSNGQPVQQWQCGRSQFNQEWQFQPTGGGYYRVVNRNTGLVWDVTGGAGATGNGTKIQQWSYAGGTNQQWQPQSLGNGYYRFVALNSGKCLDASNSATNGVQLVQNTCSNARSQDFFLTQQP